MALTFMQKLKRKFNKARRWLSFKASAIAATVVATADKWLPQAKEYLPPNWTAAFFLAILILSILEESHEEE